jgi:hypothetical protein
MANRRRWLPRVLGHRTELHDGREWAVVVLAPAVKADLRADGQTFKRNSSNAVLAHPWERRGA